MHQGLIGDWGVVTAIVAPVRLLLSFTLLLLRRKQLLKHRHFHRESKRASLAKTIWLSRDISLVRFNYFIDNSKTETQSVIVLYSGTWQCSKFIEYIRDLLLGHAFARVFNLHYQKVIWLTSITCFDLNVTTFGKLDSILTQIQHDLLEASRITIKQRQCRVPNLVRGFRSDLLLDCILIIMWSTARRIILDLNSDLWPWRGKIFYDFKRKPDVFNLCIGLKNGANLLD